MAFECFYYVSYGTFIQIIIYVIDMVDVGTITF